MLLALVSVFHFFCVETDERVEVSTKLVLVSVSLFLRAFFWTEDSAETLGFLSSGTCVGGNLDDDVGVWDIDTCITNSWKNDCVDLMSISKMRDDVVSFTFFDFSTDERNI